MTKEMYEDLLERNKLQISELNTLTEEQDRHIIELEKENAELQEKLNMRSCQNCKRNNKSCPNDGSCVHYNKWEGYKNPQLTKAKEIIKRLNDIVCGRSGDDWELIEQAEQFLIKVEE